MNRETVIAWIKSERDYQDSRCGREFDKKNTPNDWVAHVANYLGKAVTMPFHDDIFRINIIKVAALCVAALEQDEYAPRHYDE